MVKVTRIDMPSRPGVVRPGSGTAMVLAFALSLGPTQGRAASAASWTIDPARTHLSFSIDAVGYARTDGEFHRFEGNLSVDFDQPDRSRVRFQVDSDSADVGSSLLNDYLRSEALLNAAHFKSIVFSSVAVRKVDDNNVEVTGDLSMLGVTRPLVVKVTVRRQAAPVRTRLGFTATATIDRLAYGMNAGFPIVSRDVRLQVDSEASSP